MDELRFPQEYGLLKQKLQFELQERFGEEAYMLTRLLLEDFKHLLLADPNQLLLEKDVHLLQSRVKRLFADEPIQYILEKAHFYGRDFKVSPAVLIPRRETEELMYWIREDLKKKKGKPSLRVLDIGTGSGCIPISLDLELTEAGLTAEVWGMDISHEALEIAQENSRTMNSQCQFFQGDIFMIDAQELGNWDLIVSNPPYIPLAEKKIIATRVKDHEPALALFVPDHDPLRFYKRIAELAFECLRPGGCLFFEIHEEYGEVLTDFLKAVGFRPIFLKKDMQGKNRMIRSSRP